MEMEKLKMGKNDLAPNWKMEETFDVITDH
jgi:hypothetical protein